ncbi:hypothetical protein GCM10008955_23910 [Deinococcus malanensis]|uniref:Uncharacterized protein n=1 Tax=Deinococcus malanensis TaxID=1706855 RepID=A0ABQ2EW72_9DEIO|nr:hypothetical protein GCM10008955_23910 [Deinococcus malanensis]
MLEQIISAGKEQVSVTRSLQQVIAVTLTQLRELSGGATSQEAQKHIATLQGIIISSQEQIKTATELRQAIQRTLEDVRGTPLEDVSGTLLNTLSTVVRRQIEQLQELIATAVSEADTAGQVAELQQVSAEAQIRHTQVEHEQEERELAQLEILGGQALERVRELEESGRTHEAQRVELEEKAEDAGLQISALESEERENRAQLALLEKEEVASMKARQALEAQVERSRAQMDSPLGAYKSVVFGGLHRMGGKQHIERFNTTLGARLTHLPRRLRSFCRRPFYLETVIWLFIHRYNASLSCIHHPGQENAAFPGLRQSSTQTQRTLVRRSGPQPRHLQGRREGG